MSSIAGLGNGFGSWRLVARARRAFVISILSGDGGVIHMASSEFSRGLRAAV